MLRTIGFTTAAVLIFLYILTIQPVLVLAGLFGGLYGYMMLYGAFCAQLSVQAIVMIVQAKRTAMVAQRAIAVALILALPLVLLLIAAPILSQSGTPLPQLSGQRWNLLLIISFIAQVIGSVWMWLLIVKLQIRAEPIIRQSVTETVSPSSRMIEASAYVPLVAPLNPRRKKVGLIVLLLPLVLFVISIVVSAIVKLLDPIPGTFSGDIVSALGSTAHLIGVVSTLIFFPFFIAGIVLITKGR